MRKKAKLRPELDAVIKQRTEIRAKIEEGFAAAQRAELIDSGDVRSRLEEKKRAWLGENR
jgi:hypothetical protein